MATTATPLPGGQRPNIASAAVRFPAVATTSRSTTRSPARSDRRLGWFAALGIAILCMLIGAIDAGPTRFMKASAPPATSRR